MEITSVAQLSSACFGCLLFFRLRLFCATLCNKCAICSFRLHAICACFTFVIVRSWDCLGSHLRRGAEWRIIPLDVFHQARVRYDVCLWDGARCSNMSFGRRMRMMFHTLYVVLIHLLAITVPTGLSLSITLYSVALNTLFSSYRARLGLHKDLSQDAWVNHSRFDAGMNLLLACILHTLKP